MTEMKDARIAVAAERVESENIPFGPRGCPDARRSLLTTWTPELLKQISAEFGVADPMTAIQYRLSEAELYWVSPEMCELWATAEKGIPRETPLTPEMLICAEGIAFLATKHHVRFDDEETYAIDALEWTYGKLHDGRGGVSITAYAYHGVKDVGDGWVYCSNEDWPFGSAIGEDEGIYRYDYTATLRSRLASLFLLIASPGITETQTQRPDRASARRSQRLGINPDLDVIRVIYLRSNGGGQSVGSDGDSYHHRWIVSGHWRNQTWGPRGTLRRPTWIAPHVKGPDGAPMLHGEKVRAVVR